MNCLGFDSFGGLNHWRKVFHRAGVGDRAEALVDDKTAQRSPGGLAD